MSDDEDRLLIDDHDMSGGPAVSSMEGSPSKTTQSSHDIEMKNEETEHGANSLQIYPVPILGNAVDPKEIVSTIDQGKQLDAVPTLKIDESREEGEIIDDLDPDSSSNNINLTASNKRSSNEEKLKYNSSDKEKNGAKRLLGEKLPNSSTSLSIDTRDKSSPSQSIKSSPASSNKSKISPENKYLSNGVDHSPHHKHRHSVNASTNYDKKKVKEEPREDRKRSASVLRPNDPQSSKRLKKEVGTSVKTMATNGDTEENLFDQAPGTQGLLNYTVVCKTDSNAIYISVRFKDEEYFGVISDGQPMSFAYKKRSTMNGGQNRGREGEEKEVRGDKENGGSTPSKNRTSLTPGTPRDLKRTNRGSSAPVEKKRSVVGVKTEDKDEEEGDSNDGTSRSGQDTMLCEIPPAEEQHVCGVDGCGHRYSKGQELEYHKAHAHPSKKVITDNSGSQTNTASLVDKGVDSVTILKVDAEVQTDGQVGSIICGLPDSEQQRSIALLMDKARRDTVDTIPATTSEDRHSAYSDLSDDGAPTLNKEATPNRTSSAAGGRSSAFAGTTNSAFTPTEAGLRNEETAASVLQSASASNLPVANSAPSAHSTAFHPVIDTTGKARPSSVASNPSQPLTASPRPAIPMGPNANAYMNMPFMMMNAPFPAAPSSSSPARPNNEASQHKIHELKAKAMASSANEQPLPIHGGAASSLPSGTKNTGHASGSVPSTARSVTQGMPTMMMMPGQAAPMQQMAAAQHMAAAQQMQQIMMLFGSGRGVPFTGDPAMAQQFAAMQAASMFGPQGGPHMYPK